MVPINFSLDIGTTRTKITVWVVKTWFGTEKFYQSNINKLTSLMTDDSDVNILRTVKISKIRYLSF